MRMGRDKKAQYVERGKGPERRQTLQSPPGLAKNEQMTRKVIIYVSVGCHTCRNARPMRGKFVENCVRPSVADP